MAKDEISELCNYLRSLRGDRLPDYDPIPEEVKWEPPFADIPDGGEDYIECTPDDYHPFIPADVKPVLFSAFLDGVQRTVVCDRILLPNGAKVPICIAHIAAGVILRREKILYFNPEFWEERYLLLAPFEGMIETGAKCSKPPFNKESPESLKSRKVFWCDITFPGIIEKPSILREELSFKGERLFESINIRERAQTRVAVWRQMLELLILKQFAERYPDEWILVDGPLFYDLRWCSRLGFPMDKAIKAVGYIKSIREKPKDLSVILKLKGNERSPVKAWERVRMPKGGRYEDEKAVFPRRHFKWYIRQRTPRGWEPPDNIGLVAIDIDPYSLGISSSELNPDNFKSFSPRIDEITLGVWRERWPAPSFQKDFRWYVQLYPIEELEKLLHARLLPQRMLATLGLRVSS